MQRIWDHFCFPGFSLSSHELQTTKLKNFRGKFGTKLQEQEAREEGLSSAAKRSFKGTQRTLRDRGLSSLDLTQTDPCGHPAKLGLLTLQGISESRENLPLLRKTVGNPILPSAPFSVCFKEKLLPSSEGETLQMLYIAQQLRAWGNEYFFMLQDFQECPNLHLTRISKGEQSQKSPLNRSGPAHRKCKGFWFCFL